MADKKALDEALAEAQRIRSDNLDKWLAWYDRHAYYRMLLFRGLGTLHVAIAAVLPVIATAGVELNGRSLITLPPWLLPVAALALAVLAGVSSFYHFESNWRRFRMAQVALEDLGAAWDAKLMEVMALGRSDVEKALALLLAETQRLQRKVSEVRSRENADFFLDVRPPGAEKDTDSMAPKGSPS